MNTEIEFKPSHTATSLLWGSLLFCSRIFSKRENRRKHFFIFIDRFSVRFTVCLSSVADREYSSMSLGKVREGEKKTKSTSEWLSHLSGCDSEEQRAPHLDTGHIERIYLGVSRSACSLSRSFREVFQHRWNEECIHGGTKTGLSVGERETGKAGM